MIRTALATGLLALSVFACSDDGTPGDNGEEMKLYATTKILDEATLALTSDVAADQSTFAFNGSNAVLDGVVVGDVIMGGVSPKTPSGLLRKVTAVEKIGGSVRFVTEHAGLGDAIEEGHIRLPLTRLRKEGSTITPQATSKSGLRTMNNAATSFDQDFTLGINDIDLGNGAKGGASIGFGLGIDLDLTVSLKKVSGKLVVSGSETATVDVHALVAGKFGKSVPVGGVTFPPIVFKVGVVPIVITSGLSVSVGIEGKASAAFDWAASESAAVSAGLEIGTNGVTPIHDGSATASADPVSLNGNLEARGYAELKLDVAVNALLVKAAFYAGAQAYVKLGVDTAAAAPAPCWTMSRGVDGIYGIDTKLLGIITLVKEDKRFNVFDDPFDTGACSNDPLAVTPWAKVFGASQLDRDPRGALLSDQSVVIGSTTAGSQGYLARLTPNGEPLWENAIGGTVGFNNVSPAPANDGSAWAFGSSQTKPYFAHLDESGTKTKASYLLSPDLPRPSGAKFVASKDGGMLVGGYTRDAADKYHQWAAKIDAAGQIVWAKTYGDLGEPRAIAEANDGGILLVGDTVVSPGAATQVTRLSPTGDVVFAKTFGEGRLHDVIPIAGGGLAAVGATAQGNGAVVLRIADDGTLTWGFSYRDTSAEKAEYQAYAIAERSDGFVVAGRRGFGVGADFWAMQVSADGGLGWSRTYGGTKNDEVTSARRTSDNGTLLIGETSSWGADSHVMVVRIPPSGAFEFTPGSGGSTKNVEGAKEALPGQPTTKTATPAVMTVSTSPAVAEDWPFTPKTATVTKL